MIRHDLALLLMATLVHRRRKAGNDQFVLCALRSCAFLYRKAVAPYSPGLPRRQPRVTGNGQFNRNAVASTGATRSGLIMIGDSSPVLKQYWALRRNRFAVPVSSLYCL